MDSLSKFVVVPWWVCRCESIRPARLEYSALSAASALVCARFHGPQEHAPRSGDASAIALAIGVVELSNML